MGGDGLGRWPRTEVVERPLRTNNGPAKRCWLRQWILMSKVQHMGMRPSRKLFPQNYGPCGGMRPNLLET
jgi:hypothetical protein